MDHLPPEGAFSRSASGHSSPLDPPRVFPAGARVCRPGFAPGRKMHLIKAHTTAPPSGRGAASQSEGRITSSWVLIQVASGPHRSTALLGLPSCADSIQPSICGPYLPRSQITPSTASSNCCHGTSPPPYSTTPRKPLRLTQQVSAYSYRTPVGHSLPTRVGTPNAYHCKAIFV